MPNLPYKNTAATLGFGGVVLTINAVTYRAMNWKPAKATRSIERKDTNGDVADFMLRPEPTKQSGLTLQLATATTAVPAMGTEFTGPDSLVYVVTAASPSRPEGDFWTADIDYRSKSLPTD